MNILLVTIILSGCLHWVELVDTLNKYAPVQIQQVLLKSRYLPKSDQQKIRAALSLIYKARVQHKDPVRLAYSICGVNEA